MSYPDVITGTVQFLNAKDDFGIISSEYGNQLFNDVTGLEIGDTVTFSISPIGPKGPQAVNVTKVV